MCKFVSNPAVGATFAFAFVATVAVFVVRAFIRIVHIVIFHTLEIIPHLHLVLLVFFSILVRFKRVKFLFVELVKARAVVLVSSPGLAARVGVVREEIHGGERSGAVGGERRPRVRRVATRRALCRGARATRDRAIAQDALLAPTNSSRPTAPALFAPAASWLTLQLPWSAHAP